MDIQLHTAELDGKKIAYHSESKFEVQIGKGKSAYRTKAIFDGNLAAAVAYYRAINYHSGYKKRLVCWTMNNPVLARHIS